MLNQKRIEEFLTARGRLDARKLMFTAYMYDASETDFGTITLCHIPDHVVLPIKMIHFKVRNEEKIKRIVSLCGDSISFSKINYIRLKDKLSMGSEKSPSFRLSEIRKFDITYVDNFAKIRIFFTSDAFAFLYMKKEDIIDVNAILNEFKRHKTQL